MSLCQSLFYGLTAFSFQVSQLMQFVVANPDYISMLMFTAIANQKVFIMKNHGSFGHIDSYYDSTCTLHLYHTIIHSIIRRKLKNIRLNYRRTVAIHGDLTTNMDADVSYVQLSSAFRVLHVSPF